MRNTKRERLGHWAFLIILGLVMSLLLTPVFVWAMPAWPAWTGFAIVWTAFGMMLALDPDTRRRLFGKAADPEE